MKRINLLQWLLVLTAILGMTGCKVDGNGAADVGDAAVRAMPKVKSPVNSLRVPFRKPVHDNISEEDWARQVIKEEEYEMRDPWTEEQVKRRMARHRFSLDELGYVRPKDGIWDGSVLVCGHFLKPPFVLACKPCQAEGWGTRWIGRKLLVNGVILYSDSRVDECGRKRPKEFFEGFPPPKPTECQKKFFGKIDEIQKNVNNLPVGVDPKIVEKIVMKGAEELKELSCPDGKPSLVFKRVLKPRKIAIEIYKKTGKTGTWLGYGMEFLDDGTLGSNTIRFPYDRSKIKPKTPEEMEKDSDRQCKMTLTDVERYLKDGNLVICLGHTPTPVAPWRERKLKEIVRSDLDLLSKRKLLKSYGASCPECLMANSPAGGGK